MLPSRQQGLHVRGDAGDAEETRLLVEETLEPVRVVPLLAHEVQEDAGVEVTAARTHHDAADGGQSHRRVHRASIPDGDQARAVAEVRNDRPRQGARTEHADDVFVGQPVKAVASQRLAPEPARERKAPRELRHASMKRRIEARDLGQVGIALDDRLDDLERAREMQRGQRSHLSQRREQRGVDPLRRRVRGPAVHESVPDRRGRGHAALLEVGEHPSHGRAMLGGLARRIGPHRAARQQLLLRLAHPIQREFERGGAGVETQDVLRHRSTSSRAPRANPRDARGHTPGVASAWPGTRR